MKGNLDHILVDNHRRRELSHQSDEEIRDDKILLLYPGVQPLSYFECQVADEIIESETDDGLI